MYRKLSIEPSSMQMKFTWDRTHIKVFGFHCKIVFCHLHVKNLTWQRTQSACTSGSLVVSVWKDLLFSCCQKQGWCICYFKSIILVNCPQMWGAVSIAWKTIWNLSLIQQVWGLGISIVKLLKDFIITCLCKTVVQGLVNVFFRLPLCKSAHKIIFLLV